MTDLATQATCETCPHIEIQPNCYNGRCRRFPPPYPNVEKDDWCGEHPDRKATHD
jgi:hypothetical protein